MSETHVDREMYCPSCGLRAFTSLAPELVDQRRQCPRCAVPLTLAALDAPPLPSKPYRYPTVVEVHRTRT